MEWYEIIGLAFCVILGAFIRNYVYENKYKWRNDSWKGKGDKRKIFNFLKTLDLF
jgi:hypothetical protein